MAFKQADRMDGSSAAKLEETQRLHAEAVARAQKNPDIGEKEVHDTLGAKDLPARYKIEVFFGPNRTLNGPNAVKVLFWESGRRLHGGGDDLMYMCKNREDLDEGCGKLFGSDCVRGSLAICPACTKAINVDLCVRDMVFRQDQTEDYRITTKKLSELLAKYWYRLDGNSDIYCKYDKNDIRYLAVEKQYGIHKAKQLRGLSIYPLKNIIVDTAHGASLESQIYKFLTA
jgi:hypothetical protein